MHSPLTFPTAVTCSRAGINYGKNHIQEESAITLRNSSQNPRHWEVPQPQEPGCDEREAEKLCLQGGQDIGRGSLANAGAQMSKDLGNSELAGGFWPLIGTSWISQIQDPDTELLHGNLLKLSGCLNTGIQQHWAQTEVPWGQGSLQSLEIASACRKGVDLQPHSCCLESCSCCMGSDPSLQEYQQLPGLAPLLIQKPKEWQQERAGDCWRYSRYSTVLAGNEIFWCELSSTEWTSRENSSVKKFSNNLKELQRSQEISEGLRFFRGIWFLESPVKNANIWALKCQPHPKRHFNAPWVWSHPSHNETSTMAANSTDTASPLAAVPSEGRNISTNLLWNNKYKSCIFFPFFFFLTHDSIC